MSLSEHTNFMANVMSSVISAPARLISHALAGARVSSVRRVTSNRAYKPIPGVSNMPFVAAVLIVMSALSSQVFAQDDESYVLDSGDRIAIQVFDENDLTMDSTIGDSGVINYSYLGNIQVAGKTTKELENDLIKLLQDGYLVNPSVNVSVVEYRPFFINGEVNNPGGYPYQPGLTLDKAVSLAGGLTDRASRRKMFLIKANSDGKQIKVDMSARIQPGDVISIKEGFF